MLVAPHPEDEATRLAALLSLEVLDSGPEAEFDALVHAASLVCGTPISLISLIDTERQWFKANVGLPGVSETPRDVAFCSHAILGDGLFEVADASLDARFADNPLVAGQPDIRFYAGAPLRLSDGSHVGTLCVIDRQPRQLSENQREVLRSLATAAAHALEGRRAIRAVRQAAQDVVASEARFRALSEASPLGVFATDPRGACTYTNERWQEIYGLTLAQSLGAGWAATLHPDDQARVVSDLRQSAREQREFSMEYRILHPQTQLRHLHARARAVLGPDRDVVGYVGSVEDVTERRQLAAQLAEQHELLRVTLQSIGDAVITTDARGDVVWLNPVAERMTGWTSAEARGRPSVQVFHIVNEENRQLAESPVVICLAQQSASGLASRTLLVSRDGHEYGIEDSAAPIRNAAGHVLGVVLVFHDVTEQRRMTGEMSYRATHDALTGLVNRVEFETRLRRVLRKAQEDKSAHALMYIDLDQFKLVNDACGHAVGDELLQQVSKLLFSAVRDRDTLARLGGDEFGVILEHCTAEQAQRVAQQICDRMDDFRFVHDGRRFRIGTSIGLVPVDSRWATTELILQAADTSCYAAKEAGRNRVHAWFDTDQAMRARHGEMQWTTRIEQALDEDRFVLYAQRIEALGDAAQGLHAEVLLRMRAADGALVPPGAFLPAAERFHLASRIDRWVLARSIAWMKRMTTPNELVTLSVNLSGQSVGDRAFHRWAIEVLSEAGDPICRRLCLEITETAAVTNLADAAVFIEQVRAVGVRVALDDFGAGASSFGYLKSMPVDFLKIDGQFIRDLVTDPLNEAAVRCFAEVARVVGMKTVAEFVDKPEVLARLRVIGVDYAQGFLLHRPEPIDALLELQAS